MANQSKAFNTPQLFPFHGLKPSWSHRPSPLAQLDLLFIVSVKARSWRMSMSGRLSSNPKSEGLIGVKNTGETVIHEMSGGSIHKEHGVARMCLI